MSGKRQATHATHAGGSPEGWPRDRSHDADGRALVICWCVRTSGRRSIHGGATDQGGAIAFIRAACRLDHARVRGHGQEHPARVTYAARRNLNAAPPSSRRGAGVADRA